MRRQVWTHLPAIGLWIGFVVWFLSHQSEWPSRIPLQIDWSGQVTSWGSPWLVFGLVAGLGLFFISLTFLLDELWARQESRKRFNFLSLLDEFVLSLLVAVQGSFLLESVRELDVYHTPWQTILPVVFGAVLLGTLIELKRPVRASSTDVLPAQRTTEVFRKHLRARLAAGETIVFWDIQNPKYVSWLSIGIPLALWLSAGFLIRESLWAACLNAAIGVLLLLFFGGQRTRVSRNGIIIRYGLMGIPIFRCQLSEIEGHRIRSFAPLADFGGYGIRVAKGVTAYYLAGQTGVQLDLVNRRSVLIGSSSPERLAAVIEALSGIVLKSESEVAL
ncbi:hypothetical protein KAJ02_02045 [Candidatus Bipolaricaulota bacterium]|nr:hypothetical protein [Candidatus Bipolaricaulota bacterium]